MKCCRKWFAPVTIVIAVIIALIACTGLSDNYQVALVGVAKFFDVIIPILGVGALIKYLFSSTSCKYCAKKSESGCCDSAE